MFTPTPWLPHVALNAARSGQNSLHQTELFDAPVNIAYNLPGILLDGLSEQDTIWAANPDNLFVPNTYGKRHLTTKILSVNSAFNGIKALGINR